MTLLAAILLILADDLGPFKLQLGGVPTGGIQNEVLQIGVNMGKDGYQADKSSPAISLNIENDFWFSDIHYQELNLNQIASDGTIRRYMDFSTDRDRPDAVSSWKWGISGLGVFEVATASPAATGGKKLLTLNTKGNLVTGGATLGFGDALTIGIPPLPNASIAVRTPSNDDLFSLQADPRTSQVDFRAVGDSNSGFLTFSTQQGWKVKERVRIENNGTVDFISGILRLGTNSLCSVGTNLFWNGRKIITE